MDYSDKDLLKLLENPLFRKWIYNPDEATQAYWANYQDAHPQHIEKVQEARQILLALEDQNTRLEAQEKNKLWDSIESEIQAVEDSPSLGLPSKQAHFWPRYRAVTVAASVLLLIVLYTLTLPNDDSFVMERTGFKEIKSLVLPDQSQVFLNANSSLKYLPSWAEGQKREIWIEGEAYLEVVPQKDSSRFVVHTPKLDVEVLGTKFDIYDRPGKSKVVLNEGSVKVVQTDRRENQALYLKPGEMLMVQADSLIKNTVEAKMHNAWIRKEIILNQSSIQELSKILEDFYGLKIVLEEPALGKRVFSSTTHLPLNDLDLLLEVIENLFQVKVSKTDSTIVLKSL